MNSLVSGAASIDISPHDAQFLFGYPHVERYSTAIHDPLLSSALYLENEQAQLIFVSNDIIFVGKQTAARARERIAQATGVPIANIMVTATHTHSGPITVDYASNAADTTVPKADPAYVQLLEDGIVDAAVLATQHARPAEAGLCVARAQGVGTNRRDPTGPADPEVPVLLVRDARSHTPSACMVVCSMHPTVLHEDSTLVSADFPGFTRSFLQHVALNESCPVLYHTGPAGNQSPRHVTRANTFEEAQRLGELLGQSIAEVIPQITFSRDISLQGKRSQIDLPRRPFAPVAEAEESLRRAVAKLERLRGSSASRQDVRTAEVDWFGTEETLTLARAAAAGRLDAFYAACLPAEVQALHVGPWVFVGWPGEVFVEFSLSVKNQQPDTFVISLANGELQGYVVTEEAAAEGGYEASNGLFEPEAGRLLVEKTLRLLEG